MHFLNRLLTLCILTVIVLPGMSFALVSLDDRQRAERSLDQAYVDIAGQYSKQSGVEALQRRGELQMQEAAVSLDALEDQKSALRSALAKQKDIVRYVEETYNVSLPDKEAVRALIETEKERAVALVRTQYVRMPVLVSESRSTAVDAVLHASADREDARVLLSVQQRFVRDLVSAQKALWKIETLSQQREEVLDRYWEAQHSFDQAESLVRRSNAQLRHIQRIVEEVHRDVLAMQGELSRIDAQLRRSAQHALVEKGLLSPQEARQAVDQAQPGFLWPVRGKVSAGFHNAAYKNIFGVEHDGMDIVVPQSTPVHSSADGVVYLVRDGGATGYTYILIAHRNGFATLYGHLSSTLVHQGQEVRAGAVIGLSGGKPGTRGAGPMTTGPHLHFEVIHSGVNIDPSAVLP